MMLEEGLLSAGLLVVLPQQLVQDVLLLHKAVHAPCSCVHASHCHMHELQRRNTTSGES